MISNTCVRAKFVLTKYLIKITGNKGEEDWSIWISLKKDKMDLIVIQTEISVNSDHNIK